MLKLSHHARADLLLVLVTLLAAGGWVFSREALTGLPPLLFIGLRFLLAGTALLLLGLPHIGRLANWKLLRNVLGTGVLMAVALQFWILGLAQGENLGEGAFITSLGVVIVPVFSWLLFRETADAATWLAIPIAVMGLACLTLEGGFALAPGQVYFLVAAVLFSLHFTLISRLAKQLPPALLAATQLLIVGILALVVSAYMETWPEMVPLAVLGWLMASAVIASSLRFGLQTYAQGLAPASHAALIMVLEPVWTTLLGMLWYSERMGVVQALGCILIFSAMLIARWRWIRALLRRKPN